MNLNPSTTRAGLTESARNPVCLASYLSVGVTGAMMATAHTEAAVVNIDITNVLGSGADISGVNAGMTFGQADRDVNNWLGCANAGIQIYFDSDYIGVLPSGWMMFASDGDARPRNFASGAMIDAAAPWSFSDDDASFYYGSDGEISPNFGAGSFMGFRFSGDFGTTWNYGYLEVLWTWGGTPSSSTFEILGGAWESTANTGIVAGATAPSGVPVPAASLLALMALGGNSFRRNRARAA
jgi:hypothetical protein